MQTLESKFLNSIESGRLMLTVGTKNWYSYVLEIQKLIWERNLVDGYTISIFDKNLSHITTVRVDNNLGKISFYGGE